MNKQTNRGFHPDVPMSVRSHLLGDNHTQRHKFIFGSLIMLCGVSLTNACASIDSVIIHVIADIAGWGLHAVGLLPIIKSIDKGGTL